MFKNPMERQAKVEELAEKEFERIQRQKPEFVARCGKDNILCDLRMEIAMSLPLDEQTEAESGGHREEEDADAEEEDDEEAPFIQQPNPGGPARETCGSPDDTSLHQAVKARRLGEIKELLNQGADPDARNHDGETPLHVAADTWNLGAAMELLARGAEVNVTNGAGETPLHKCCNPFSKSSAGTVSQKENEVPVAAILLNSGANINAQEKKYGITPLHLSVMWNRMSLARFLIDAGADLRVQTKEGVTALWYAMNRGGPEMARLLSKSGAVALASRLQRTELLYDAIVRGDTDLAKALLEAGVHPNFRTTTYHYPMATTIDGFLGIPKQKPPECDGKVVAESTLRSWTLLHWAAYLKRSEIVSLLLDHGADKELRDADGRAADDMIRSANSGRGAGGRVSGTVMAEPEIFAENLEGLSSEEVIKVMDREMEYMKSGSRQQGSSFNPVALADELKRDFDKLSKLGVTLAKGAWAAKMGGIGTGIAVGWRINPFLGAAIAGAGFLAKGLAKGWNQIKIDQIRQKWFRTLSNMNQEQLNEFATTVKQRYPLLMDGLAMMLAPPGGPKGYLE